MLYNHLLLFKHCQWSCHNTEKTTSTQIKTFASAHHRQLGVVSIELSIILWLQVITENYWELRPLLNTVTNFPITRSITLTDVPSKIIPQCSLCLQVTTHKIWSRYLHIQRRSEPFPHSDQRCLFCTIGHLYQNCINFLFSDFAYIFPKYYF